MDVGSPEGSGGPVFLAFHVNCPNRYLSEESINNARENLGTSPAYILGRIIMVEQHVASEVGKLQARAMSHAMIFLAVLMYVCG